MAGILRNNVLAVVLADTGPTGLMNMLGDGANSVLPHAGVQPPASKAPWIEFQIFGETRQSEIISVLGFRYRVYDVPEQNFSRIDRIIARLMQLYKSEVNVKYDDPGGRAFFQRFSFTSEDAFDDGFSQHVRWVEWQLWRALQ